jgi:hypothetical protein
VDGTALKVRSTTEKLDVGHMVRHGTWPSGRPLVRALLHPGPGVLYLCHRPASSSSVNQFGAVRRVCMYSEDKSDSVI